MVWVVWLSLRRAKEQAWPIRLENFWIGQSLSNRIKIESDGRFEFESNLEASQVPTTTTITTTSTTTTTTRITTISPGYNYDYYFYKDMCIWDYMFPQYLQYPLMDFRQTLVIGASWDNDEPIVSGAKGQRSRSHYRSMGSRTALDLGIDWSFLVSTLSSLGRVPKVNFFEKCWSSTC